MRIIISERLDRPLARRERTRRMRKAVKVEAPHGRTTLTAANGEYDEESERAVVTPPGHSEIGYGFPL